MIISIDTTELENKCPNCGTEQTVALAGLVAGKGAPVSNPNAITLPACPNCAGVENLWRTPDSPFEHAAYVNGLHYHLGKVLSQFHADWPDNETDPEQISSIVPTGTVAIPNRVGFQYAIRAEILVDVTVDLETARAIFEASGFLTAADDAAIGALVEVLYPTEAQQTAAAAAARIKRDAVF